MHGVVEYDISPIRGPLANAFVILINALFFNIRLIGLNDMYPMDCSRKLLNEEESIFDFIVVGAGAAGCAVANRISEKETWTVLLIEAGDYPSPTSNVPALYTTLIGSKEDWKFIMEKEPKACKGFANERCTISRGRVLGGTSTINNLLYSRGQPEDFDQTEFLSWDSETTTKIFHTMEGHSPNSTTFIHLDFTNYTETPKQLLEEAYLAAGYRRMPKRHAIGFMDHLTLKKSGERINMAKIFLTPVKNRPNLFFSRNTEVEAIGVTEPVDKRANGVNVTIDGIRFFLRARKEVILTAGAINNAKLLLLSGIGPKDYLTAKNLPFYADVPAVGQNLQMHLTVPIYVASEPSNANQKEYYFDEELIRDTFDYVMYRSGNFSNTNINELVAYILTKKIGTTFPNLAVHHMYFRIGDRNLLSWIDAMNYHPKIINALINSNRGKALILFMVTLLKPVSRGEVLLNETHFTSNPSIKGNFFADVEDWDYQTMLSGFSFIANLTEKLKLKTHHSELVDLDIPNCRNFKFCTPAYVKCYIHNMAFPDSEATGTAKMGADCDETAVVKEDLEVRKVRCLRVADSSVLNFLPTGNTVATDAMIGYNLGEILREKWVKDYVSVFRGVKQEDGVH
ncbi:unnamed protein product [Phaedon cochleariae]|uniref:Glucose-methanol-choline oxidoreductase N-terminal domain-containing protein n=1 Tax=Phaedon cochleariae TaxID=80249 RepID=A0A9P0DP47_PHACE|nr:unnamed protein product [Phaedon cochleariae]